MRRCDGPLWAICLASTLLSCVAIWGGCKTKTPRSSQAKGDVQTSSQSRNPDAVTCHFSAESKAELDKALAKGRVDPEASVILRSSIVKECLGWPPFIAKSFVWLKPIGAFDDSPSVKGKAAEVLFSDREDIKRRLEGWCPGYGALMAGDDQSAQGAPKTPGPESNAKRGLWEVCQMDALFTKAEFEKHHTENLVIYTIFQSLLAAGLKAPVARLLARLWVPVDPTVELATRYKVTFPQGRSAIAPLVVDAILISTTEILLRYHTVANISNGRIRAEDKMDGEESLFIDALSDHLRVTATQLDGKDGESSTTGGRWLTLATDATTRFRLLLEVLYTASSTGFTRFQVLLDNPEVLGSVVVFEFPQEEEGAAPPAFTDRVILRPTEIELRLGPKAVSQRIPLPQADRESAFEVLASRLQAHYSGSGQGKPGSPAKPDRKAAPSSPAPVLLVEPTAEVGLQDIVHALLAVRAISKEPQAATSSGSLLARGCPLRPNTKNNDFIIDPKDQAAWMYPIPRLSLQGVMGKK